METNKLIACQHIRHDEVPRHQVFTAHDVATCSSAFFVIIRRQEEIERLREIYSPQANNRCDNQNKLKRQAAREEIPI